MLLVQESHFGDHCIGGTEISQVELYYIIVGGMVLLSEVKEISRFACHHKSLNFILRLETVTVTLKQDSNMI